jgi:hypothetical protein
LRACNEGELATDNLWHLRVLGHAEFSHDAADHLHEHLALALGDLSCDLAGLVCRDPRGKGGHDTPALQSPENGAGREKNEVPHPPGTPRASRPGRLLTRPFAFATALDQPPPIQASS